MLSVIFLVSAAALKTAAADFSEGMAALEKERYADAAQHFTRIIEAREATPLFDDALFWRGRAAEAAGRKDDARKDYLQILQDGKSEYAGDAMKSFVELGGNRAELVDRSTPKKMWESFCRAVFERDAESAISCLGNELKKDVELVLKEDPGAFWTDIFSDLARMRALKVEEKGDNRAVLRIGLAGDGKKGGMFALDLVKNEEGWTINDALEAEPPENIEQATTRKKADDSVEDVASYEWPEGRISRRQAARLRSLMEKLGSESFIEREHAEREIIGMGTAAGSAVVKYLDDDDPEVRLRVKKILRKMIMNERENGSGGGQ